MIWNSGRRGSDRRHARDRALRLRNVADGSACDLDADALFIAIGHAPNTGIFRRQLDLDETGYIVSPDGVQTNIEASSSPATCTTSRYKQAITAAGSGCSAAMDAEKYLEAMEFRADSLARR